jgi:hypothetical protein
MQRGRARFFYRTGKGGGPRRELLIEAGRGTPALDQRQDPDQPQNWRFSK